MARQIVVRAEAEADIDAAYGWYEARSLGLGAEFVRAVDACLAAIARQPELHAEQYRGARRALLRRFPYGVFYLVWEDHIEVVACFHLRRDPRRWQTRLSTI